MKMGNSMYKLGVGLALATPLLLAWMIGAVGVLGREGDPANWMSIGVFALGWICAIAALLFGRQEWRAHDETGVHPAELRDRVLERAGEHWRSTPVIDY